MYDASLVTSEVCVSCGACCSMYFKKGTTELLLPHEITSEDDVEIVSCPHLKIDQGQYLCGNYEARPDVCRKYNCLTRANRHGLAMPESHALPARMRASVRRVFGREIELQVVD